MNVLSFLRRSLVLGAAAGAVLMPGIARGQMQVYLNVPAFGPCGTSQFPGYENQIPVLGFEQVISHAMNRGGLPSAVDLRSVKITKDPDVCSPRLFLASLAGETVDAFEITFVNVVESGSVKLALIEATDFQVASMLLTRGENGPLQEAIVLAVVGTLKLTVWKLSSSGGVLGSVTTCWDFRRNRICRGAG